jgi:integrase
VLAGYYTGLRLRDIANMTWSAVDIDTGVIRLRTKKTRSEILIPLHPEFHSWLKDQTRGIGNAPVFPGLVGKGTGGKHGLSGRFTTLMGKAGVKGKQVRERNQAGRATQSLTFHSLRHSFVSALANAGVASDLRQKLAGHSDSRSHARYTHHEVANLKAAVAAIPPLLSVKL